MADDSMALGYALGQDSNCNNNCGNGWGGFGEGLWAVIILAMIFNGGFGFGSWGGGWGGNGINFPAGQGALTRADLCSEFNFNNLDNAVRGIQQGLCDGFYSQNTTLMNGFHGVDNAICQLGYQTQQGFNAAEMSRAQQQAAMMQQLNAMQFANQQCCCDTQRQIERGFCDTNYNLATNTTSIIQNAHNDTDRVIAKLDAMEATRQQEKIQALQMENQGLKFAASQAAQNTFITANQEAQTAELIRRLGRDCPVPAYVVPNPNCCYGNPVGVSYGGCGNSCGCGC